jgi:hypothetical protein
MGSFARGGSGRRPSPPQNTPNALGQAALLESRCPERPRSSRLARPPSMSASRGTCRPQNRRPADLWTPCPLASRRPERLGARRPASFTESPMGRSTCTLLDASLGVASATVPPPSALPGRGRDRLPRSAALPGLGRDRLPRSAPLPRMAQGRWTRSAPLPRMAQDRLPRSAPLPGMGRVRLSKLVPSPRKTPSTLSQPRRGIFETASSSVPLAPCLRPTEPRAMLNRTGYGSRSAGSARKRPPGR